MKTSKGDLLIGAGGLYDSEVETIRYDSNFSYLMNFEEGKPKINIGDSPLLDYDVRDLATIMIDGKKVLLVLSNNDILRRFTINEQINKTKSLN